MRFKKLILSTILAFTSIGIVGCGGSNEPVKPDKFTFSVTLEDGSKNLYVGTPAKIKITTNGVQPEVERHYEFTSANKASATVDNQGVITPIAPGTVQFYVKETVSNYETTLSNITVYASKGELANGGFNYASSSGAESIATRTEILGKLEKYAMDNHLTGITLFENGGYMKFRGEDITLPTTDYITGYGFGLLSEGSIDVDLLAEDNPNYKRYYHTALSQDTQTINAWNATGSQVGDLAGYITSSYFSTKMKSDKNGYEWYPVLAKDKITIKGVEKPQLRPTHMDSDNDVGLYKIWRIYVKTGSASEGCLAYRTAGEHNSQFNNKPVAVEDYAFAYKILLTGSNGLKRGAELAGDVTYGIKGAQKFYNNTKNETDVTRIDNIWNDMVERGELGIRTGVDATNGSYIELEIINGIDDFTAMYVFSSNLYSPIPRDFFLSISTDGTYKDAADRYGNFNSGGNNAILDYVICLGPYYLSKWEKKQLIVFSGDDNYFEYRDDPSKNRYKIRGVHMRVIDTSQDEEAVYKQFNAGLLHSTGIPTSKLDAEIGQDYVYQTEGDSTFKLNINSCTQSYWNELFGSNGKIYKNADWDVKPWMSNSNFLNGLFYSINRREFAKKRGVKPSTNYFANAYLSDPENGVSYNSTEAHKNAVKDYQTKHYDPSDKDADADGYVDDFGYDYDKAVNCFKAAVNELVKAGAIQKGTASRPAEITIHIRWMYQTDPREYGDDIVSYFENAFNDNAVSQGTVKLKVEQESVTSWEDVYNVWMMRGQFDLGFGAISGNTYNPLNFLEVLKSDNSSGFTLNWGNDTSKVSETSPILYDGKTWSFDALWAVADHGGVVENGRFVNSVKSAYMELPRNLEDTQDINDLTNGCRITIPVTFVNVPGVTFSIDPNDEAKVSLFIIGSGNIDLTYTLSADKKNIILVIDGKMANEINEKIREVNKFRKEDDFKDWELEKYLKVFTLDNYGKYWVVELYYNLTIGGSSSQNYVTIEKNKDSHEYIVE